MKVDYTVMKKGYKFSSCLTELNDTEGWCFKRIANFIERNWKLL